MFPQIILIGFAGAGKSTIGKKLASRIGWDFIDLDDAFEKKYCMKISDFFLKYEEKNFRQCEHLLLKQYLNIKETVLSTGGGTPCFFNNIDLITQSGLTIYIKMSPASLFNRLINAKKTRPFIQHKTSEEIQKYIDKTLSKREQFYNQATLHIKGEDINMQNLIDRIKLHLIEVNNSL
jgi:shikimate kinase